MTIRFNERALVLYNKKTESGAFRLGLKIKAEGVLPGHFFMLRTSAGVDPLLNRPLGAYRLLGASGEVILPERPASGVRGEEGQWAFSGEGIEFLYNVVGRGTALLAEKKEGDEIGVLGPLGRGFSRPAKGDIERLIMVGGGMGIVPFYLLSAALGGGLFLFGARSGADARLTEDFSGLGCEVALTTEDGSLGEKGLVTDLLVKKITPRSLVYACGPPGMLKAVAAISSGIGARCYVSLEKAMACGIGVCLGCAVKTRRGGKAAYSMVCSEGPVFDAEDIDWEDI